MNASTVKQAALATINDPANPAQSNRQICDAANVLLPFLGMLTTSPGMSTWKKFAVNAFVPILREIVGHLCGR